MDKINLQAWRLFITLHATLITKVDKQMIEAGKIPLHWYDVLIELYEAPEHRLRMHELAEKVVLSRSGLTRLVDRLAEAGYLMRETDPNDRRGYYCLLTEGGITALRDAWTIYSAGIQAEFADYLDADEAELLVKIFTRMLNIS
jgi:DNA-binding MarR family transcriptional regulator